MGLPIQIVDENDQPLGPGAIDEALRAGLYHRIVRVVVEGEDGSVLLQRRSNNVSTYRDCWDHAAGGYVDVGEDYEAAVARELREELGLVAHKLREAAYYKSQSEREDKRLNRFNKMYVVQVPRNSRVRFRPEEVAEVRWFSRAEVSRLVSEHSEQVTDGLIEAYQRLYA